MADGKMQEKFVRVQFSTLYYSHNRGRIIGISHIAHIQCTPVLSIIIMSKVKYEIVFLSNRFAKNTQDP